jgi:putative heme iron utilization protein
MLTRKCPQSGRDQKANGLYLLRRYEAHGNKQATKQWSDIFVYGMQVQRKGEERKVCTTLLGLTHIRDSVFPLFYTG